MKKYLVHFQEILYYSMDIEANSPEEAIEKAKDIVPDYETHDTSEFENYFAEEQPSE